MVGISLSIVTVVLKPVSQIQLNPWRFAAIPCLVVAHAVGELGSVTEMVVVLANQAKGAVASR